MLDHWAENACAASEISLKKKKKKRGSAHAENALHSPEKDGSVQEAIIRKVHSFGRHIMQKFRLQHLIVALRQ